MKQCLLFDDYLDQTLTAEKICTQGGGLYCSNTKNEADWICRGLGGTYCVNINNLAQAYCTIAGGSYCSKVEVSEVAAWKIKVKTKCKELIKNLSDSAGLPK